MNIKATVTRIEGNNAVLLLDETQIEIFVPVDAIKGICSEGETVFLSLDGRI